MLVLKLKEPDIFFQEFRGKINPVSKKAFIAAVIIALITQAFYFTSKLPNHDELFFLYNKFDNLKSGQWVSTYAGEITSYFSIP